MAGRRPSNPYRLGRSRGRGGYAEVFEATRRDGDGTVVAIKRPLRDVPTAVDRMAREIDVQQRLRHPHIMPVLDAAPDNSWLVMPLADGNLEQLWKTGKLRDDPNLVAIDVLRQVSLGLGHAHDSGFVHRDVSPRNILGFLAVDGVRWVIGDWGAVRRAPGDTTHRLTATNEGLGTRGFAAPETWRNAHSVDARADLYGLGRVAAWLLTGEWPIPNVPLLPSGPLRPLINECTRNEPQRRPASMAALRDRLEVLLEEPPRSPTEAMHALVERITADETDPFDALALASAHRENADLYIDELARLSPAAVRNLTQTHPDEMAEIALAMLHHLGSMGWGYRNFNYANVPLRWAFEVLTTLVDDDSLGLAEDVAVEFFTVDAQWDRFQQKDMTIPWLYQVPERAGVALARAMRASGAGAYYASSLEPGRMRSRSLAAECGR